MALAGFFESPQNRTGISIWIGTAITALVQEFVLHRALSPADLLGLVLGLLKIIEPENTATLAQLETVAADVKALIATHGPQALARVAADASGLVAAVDK